MAASAAPPLSPDALPAAAICPDLIRTRCRILSSRRNTSSIGCRVRSSEPIRSSSREIRQPPPHEQRVPALRCALHRGGSSRLGRPHGRQEPGDPPERVGFVDGARAPYFVGLAMIGVELLEGVYTLQRARCRRQHLLGSQGQRADFCAGANERDGKRQLAELQHFEDFFETGVVDGAVQDHVVAAGRPAGPRWRPRRIAPGPGVGQCGGRGLRRRGAQGLALRRRVARPRRGVLRHRRWRAIAAAAIGLREQFGERADRLAGRRFRRVRGSMTTANAAPGSSISAFSASAPSVRGAEVPGLRSPGRP